jgi:transmembrane 9 superfamily protein 3
MAMQYNVGEAVRLWVNKVGPYNNPQETYNYYYLPFCKPKGRDKPGHKWGGLGEVLQGNELIDSQLDIKYRSERRCSTTFHSFTALLACDREGMP